MARLRIASEGSDGGLVDGGPAFQCDYCGAIAPGEAGQAPTGWWANDPGGAPTHLCAQHAPADQRTTDSASGR